MHSHGKSKKLHSQKRVFAHKVNQNSKNKENTSDKNVDGNNEQKQLRIARNKTTTVNELKNPENVSNNINTVKEQIKSASLTSPDWCELAKDAVPFIPMQKRTNIFGEARPVDTARKMAEVERKVRAASYINMSPNYKGVTIPDEFEFDVNSFLIPGCYHGDLKSVVISEGLIKDRIKKLAYEIYNEIGDQPLIMLCVLKGSYRFFTALVDDLTVARNSCKSPLTVDFIRAKSYEDTESSGTLEIIGLGSLDELKGQNVLVVDDIVDSGLTMSRLIRTIENLGAKKVWTSLLLSKRVPRKVDVPQHFVAFNIPDKFIVGYGLDYNQKFRDLNHICEMSQTGIAKYKSK